MCLCVCEWYVRTDVHEREPVLVQPIENIRSKFVENLSEIEFISIDVNRTCNKENDHVVNNSEIINQMWSEREKENF